MWIEIGLGHADARALRGDQSLGAAHVRTPPDQVGRDAQRHAALSDGDLAVRSEQLRQSSGRFALQRGKGVVGLAQTRLQRWDQSPGLLQDLLGLLEVALGRRPGLQLVARELVGASLDLYVLLCEGD